MSSESLNVYPVFIKHLGDLMDGYVVRSSFGGMSSRRSKCYCIITT